MNPGRTSIPEIDQSNQSANLGFPHEVGHAEAPVAGGVLPSICLAAADLGVVPQHGVLVVVVEVHPSHPVLVVVDGLDHVLDGVVVGGIGAVVERVDFDAADVGVFSVLVVLEHHHPHEPAAERIPVGTPARSLYGHVDPPLWHAQLHRGEGNGLIGAEPGRDLDLGRRVTLIELIVQIKP